LSDAPTTKNIRRRTSARRRLSLPRAALAGTVRAVLLALAVNAGGTGSTRHVASTKHIASGRRIASTKHVASGRHTASIRHLARAKSVASIGGLGSDR
jgi:hypothetical protein